MSQPRWSPASSPQYEESSAVIYIADSSLNIAYCNPAWDLFAAKNGGLHLGRENQTGCSLVEITPPPLRRFYASLYARVLLDGDEAGFVYECSSAELLRRFHMHLARKTVAGNAWLVIVNSLIREEPHHASEPRPPFASLREENGLITMCSHCRRTFLPGRNDWVWIPDLVRDMPPEVSHGLCPICFDIHYGS